MKRDYHPGLYRWSILLAFCTLLLVVAGGLVTSRDAGLSVPDWPLSYGKLMPPMEGGILYEHGHRMVATTVGLLTIVSMIWLFRSERRKWLRWLGAIALMAVILQGVLGGLTVLLLLPWWISTAHACLAQLFFSTTVAMALFTSDWWLRGPVSRGGRSEVSDSGPFARRAALCAGATGAGGGGAPQGNRLHIPHFGSPIVTGVILWVSLRILLHYAENRELRLASISSARHHFLPGFSGNRGVYEPDRICRRGAADASDGDFTVLHVAVGALTMAASVALAILVRRNVPAPAREFAARGSRLSPESGCNPMRDYIALTKPRITWLILMSTGVGYFFGLKREFFNRGCDRSRSHRCADWILLLHTLIGTGLIASGTAALNQWYERDADLLMRRTSGTAAARRQDDRAARIVVRHCAGGAGIRRAGSWGRIFSRRCWGRSRSAVICSSTRR